MHLRVLLFLCCTGPLMAELGMSANYALATSTLDGGGLKGVSSAYEIDFSIGAGEAGGSQSDLSRTGFAGGLMDAVAVAIDHSASSWNLNERTTRQLKAHLILDDATSEPLAATNVDWSVLGGPITIVSASGNVTASTVYQNTSAVVRASYAGNSGTRTFNILNVGNDDFGAYAADGLSDPWQIGYFGENNGLAGQGIDADGDGLNNLQEYAFGTNPLQSSAGKLSWSGLMLLQRGVPLPYATSTEEGFRAVFSRRKDRDAAGLVYSVEFSGDLTSWQTSATQPELLAQDDEVEVVSVPYPSYINGKQVCFFRVRVTAQ